MASAKTVISPATPTGLRWRAKFMIGFLLAQYLIGMVLDFFVELPKVHPGMTDSTIWDGFWWSLTGGGGWAVAVHVAIGTLLLFGAAIFLVLACVGRNKPWIIVSSIGFVGVLGAWINGVKFVSSNDDMNSFAMAVAWVVALTAYGVGLYVAKKQSEPTK